MMLLRMYYYHVRLSASLASLFISARGYPVGVEILIDISKYGNFVSVSRNCNSSTVTLPEYSAIINLRPEYEGNRCGLTA